MNLNSPVKQAPNVSDKYQKRLRRLGIRTVGQLLFHFPHRYEDFSKITPIQNLKLGQTACIKGRIKWIRTTKTSRKRMDITRALVKDQTGMIQALWFNQPYLKDTLNTEKEVCLAGKVQLGKEGPFLSNPVYEKVGERPQIHTHRLVPVYPETEGVSSRWLRYILHPLLKEYADRIPETLPREIIEKEGLMGIKEALKQIHFPASEQKAEKARHRFAFEELFLVELRMLQEKKKVEEKKSLPVPFDEESVKQFVRSLPFELTEAQKRVGWRILQEMEKEVPMSRLLQGDVGSGKTVVAAIAALNTAQQGFQTAFMAPTEILARQHFKEFSRILKIFDPSIALLTGGENKMVENGENLQIRRRSLIRGIKEGEVKTVIGTHALIQDRVKFKNLALVIIDEQHRFGVNQRGKLRRNTPVPHLLSMTATPIPRTLALTVYGDLDLSVIDQMPEGRKEIKTEVVGSDQRNKAYEFVKKEVKKGRQAFIICPRISTPDRETESTWDNVRSVEQEYERLAGEVFPDLDLAMLHGQLDTEKKSHIMRRFQKGEIDVLVSTSVVEVGVDIPNATVMIIEGAERFGLAQLHQFRGRIGRSEHQSYCFLFTTSPTETAEKRLNALVKSNDGFFLAEKDLQIRGPGDFVGARQAGIPDLAMASLGDVRMVQRARGRAKSILDQSPFLKKYPKLKKRLKRFKKEVHLE